MIKYNPYIHTWVGNQPIHIYLNTYVVKFKKAVETTEESLKCVKHTFLQQ